MCKVQGCERGGKRVRGMCTMHYARWRLHGDPGPVESLYGARRLDPAEWFWTNNRVTESGCWEWLDATTSGGYGMTWYGNQPWRVHRLAYTLTHGEIPEGLFVLHSCDNPPCYNPHHLSVGTDADNKADVVERERSLIGERNHFSKLTEQQIAAIRADTRLQQAIADEYGIHQSHVSKIKANKRRVKG